MTAIGAALIWCTAGGSGFLPTAAGSRAVTAWTAEGEIMGLAHRAHRLWGVQFHPESILTPAGKDLLRNFLRLAGEAT